jgi:glyoxylase-like metal-dependent hydrolase (beta-lactamase superfamily II)
MNGNSAARTIGTATVTHVREWVGPLFTRPQLLPASNRERWQDNSEWLVPDFWSPETEDAWTHSQCFVVRTGETTVMIDTGIGNAKPRPQWPPFSDLDTDFLGHLAAAGLSATDIDVVVCTHLHPDHVGWNTTLRDGHWVPTSPNATYLLPEVDYDLLAHSAPDGMAAVLSDSIAPVVDAGQATLWNTEHRIDDTLTVRAAPGHSPGASVVELSSAGQHALFAGDLVHTPMQILDPDQHNPLDVDPQQAVDTRRPRLRWAAQPEAL